MAEKTATYGVKVKAETNADSAADSLQSLRDQILASQDAVRQFGAAMKGLRGNSEEVKAAKEKFTAAQNAEKDAISAASLALIKQGTSFAEVAAKMKAAQALNEREAKFRERVASDRDKHTKKTAADEIRAMKALQAAHQKYGSKKDIESLKELEKAYDKHQSVKDAIAKQEDERLSFLTGGVQKWAAAFGPAGTAIATGASIVAAAIAAVGVAFVAATVSLTKFIIEEGNVLRTMGLVNEAALQNSTNSLHMGHQIEELGTKVSFTRAELQAMQLDISRSLAGTRVTGQGIVDTFNAVAQATDAMGQSAGRTIQGIIERGKNFGQFGLGLLELQGTGITFEDVAKELGKSLKGGIDEARQQLYLGRVNINAGADALRSALEKKFANLNLRKMLDIGTIGKKFRDTLAGLTSDVDLTPLLSGLQSLGKLFDSNTVTGKTLKTLITSFGDSVVKAFSASLPYVKLLFTELLTGGIRLAIVFLDLKEKFQTLFPGDAIAKWLNVTSIMGAVRFGFVLVAEAMRTTFDIVASLATAFMAPVQAAMHAYEYILELDWVALGTNIVDGIRNGLTAAAGALRDSVVGIGDSIKKTFTGLFDMHSPSKVTEQWGRNLGAGLVRGQDEVAPQVQAATDRMAPQAPAAPSFGGGAGGGIGGGGANVTVNVKLEFPNAKDGGEVKEALTDSSFQAKFTQMLERVLRSRGVPTQKVAT